MRPQPLLQSPPPDHAVNLEALSDLAKSFCFSEVRKRTIQSRFCSVMFYTTSNQDTILNCGGVVVPWGALTLYVTFAPTVDDTLRTFLPKEIRIVFRSHKATFYQGGRGLTVVASFPLTPLALFHMALLTLLCMDQGDIVPTPT